MQTIPPRITSTRILERFLSGLGIAVCVIVCLRTWQVISGQQPLWPLPALYLLEMIAASFVGWLSLYDRGLNPSPFVGALPWVTVGILAAFVAMGAWSIGFLFFPVALLFVISAVLSDRRRGQPIAVHVGVCGVVALAQVGLMVLVIQVL